MLVPAVAIEATDYRASVGPAVAQTTVWTMAVEGASFIVKVNGVENQNGIVLVVVGSNVIAVVTSAQDGETEQTYTMTVMAADSKDTYLTASPRLMHLPHFNAQTCIE